MKGDVMRGYHYNTSLNKHSIYVSDDAKYICTADALHCFKAIFSLNLYHSHTVFQQQQSTTNDYLRRMTSTRTDNTNTHHLQKQDLESFN